MVDVVTEIIIERPRPDVARYATDPDNAPIWYVNIQRVEWRSPPPLRLGSEIAFIASFLGRQLAYTYRVTTLVPGKRLVMATTEGPFPMETTYEWESVARDGTRMRLRNRGRPSGFSILIAPLVGWAMRRANRKDLANLKKILEREPQTVRAG
jgi:polyketide cyclase/dehydrase/lipid transport protein